MLLSVFWRNSSVLLSVFWRNSSVSGNRPKQNQENDISAGASSGGEDVLPYKTQISFIPHFGDGQLQLPTFGNGHLHNAVINSRYPSTVLVVMPTMRA